MDSENKGGFFKNLFARLFSQSAPTPEATHNFSPRAQQVFTFALQEAIRLNHNFIGTEHVLLGLLRLGQGVAVNVLQKEGIDLRLIQAEVEKFVGAGEEGKVPGNAPYTPRVKKVLVFAAKEARAFNHTYVGTEHLLLGLLRESDGVAARVLRNLGVDIEKTRREILRELDPNFALSYTGSPETTSNEQAEPSAQASPKAVLRDEDWKRFNSDSQKLFAFAQMEAARLQYHFVGAEHLLLGLILLEQKAGPTIAGNALKRLVQLETVKKEIEKIGVGPNDDFYGKPPFTPCAKNILALAAEEARQLGHSYIGPEHILLGILRENNSVPARVLHNLKINFENLRLEILKEIDPNLGGKI